MNNTVKRYTYWMSIFLFLALFGASSYFAYHLWKSGSISVEGIARVIENSYLIENERKTDRPKLIQNNIDLDRVREALTEVDVLNNQYKTFSEFVAQDEAIKNKFETSLNEVKKHVMSLLSVPELPRLVGVIWDKIVNFQTFVMSNNWKTLTRTTERIRVKISETKSKRSGIYKYRQIQSAYSGILNEFSNMESITETSVLTKTEKSIIFAKINGMKNDLSLLEKYLTALNDFNNSHKKLSNAYSEWLDDLSPKIAEQKIGFEKTSKSIFYGFVILLAFCISSMIILLILRKIEIKSTTQKISKEVSDVVNEIVVKGKDDPKMSEKLAVDLYKDLLKYRDYVHKRMSFGSIFQDSLPFSSILLDVNLKVKWANKNFLENWKLSNYKNNLDALSWDHLQRFTNLGEEDPIIQAQNSNIAGIYQIQLKTSVDDEVLPYEMYVSPVEVNGATEIMIFFYPLRSLQETVGHQTKAIVGPVKKSLEAMLDSQFDDEFIERIQKDFYIAGIDEIYSLLRNLNTKKIQNFEAYENRLSEKDEIIEQSNHLINEMENAFEETKNYINEVKNSFGNTKQCILNMMHTKSDICNDFDEINQQLKETLSSLDTYEKSYKNLQEVINEHDKAFQNLEQQRSDFKQLKEKAEDGRLKVLQSVDQTLVFGRSERYDKDRIEESLNNIKIQIRSYDKIITSLFKIMGQVDVVASKVELVNQQRPFTKIPLQSTGTILASSKDIKDEFENHTKNFDQNGETMIESLKGMFSSLKSADQVVKESHYNVRSRQNPRVSAVI
ncbi:MAG: hypothetical protein H6622_06665 [Halobacteriovoraceae bacterium]|nr:hypothetical protein [Halobacteriovoraceae bacterium]